MRDQQHAIEAAFAASGIKATYGGAGVGLLGWLMQSNLVSILGFMVALSGLLVTWYYKAKQDRREEKEHKARMANLTNGES